MSVRRNKDGSYDRRSAEGKKMNEIVNSPWGCGSTIFILIIIAALLGL